MCFHHHEFGTAVIQMRSLHKEQLSKIEKCNKKIINTQWFIKINDICLKYEIKNLCENLYLYVIVK